MAIPSNEITSTRVIPRGPMRRGKIVKQPSWCTAVVEHRAGRGWGAKVKRGEMAKEKGDGRAKSKSEREGLSTATPSGVHHVMWWVWE